MRISIPFLNILQDAKIFFFSICVDLALTFTLIALVYPNSTEKLHRLQKNSLGGGRKNSFFPKNVIHSYTPCSLDKNVIPEGVPQHHCLVFAGGPGSLFPEGLGSPRRRCWWWSCRVGGAGRSAGPAGGWAGTQRRPTRHGCIMFHASPLPPQHFPLQVRYKLGDITL